MYRMNECVTKTFNRNYLKQFRLSDGSTFHVTTTRKLGIDFFGLRVVSAVLVEVFLF